MQLFFTLLACVCLSVQAFGITSAQLEASIRAATTGAGVTDFTIAPPAAGAGMSVDASTFGVSPTNSGLQNYKAFTNAIAYCKTNSASKLTIPKGTYYIGNYGSTYTANLYFSGMHDFIFDAQGSTFLFQSKCYFIKVSGCSQVQFQNMTLNWDWALEPVQSLTQLNAIDPGGNYIDLKFPYENNPSPTANIYEIAEVDSTNYNCSHQGMGVVGAWRMDFTQTTNVATNILRYFSKTSVVGNNWFNSANNNAKVGQYYVTRHFSYEAHGVSADNNNNLTFSNNIIYSTLGMGYSCFNNDHYQIIDSKIIREPGSLFHYSSASDGIHVANSFGYFKIQNVEIGNAGDDAINIHDTLSQGVTVTGSNTLIAKNAIDWRNPYGPGDLIELRQKDFTPLDFSSVVSSSVYDKSLAQYTLTFANTLPANLDANTILFNKHYNSGNYIVRNCNVHDNKVRGLLTHCANGTIENNQFLRNYNPGMFIMCVATTYAEGFNPTNIIVRNNIFDGNDIFRNNFPSMPNNVVIAGETTPSGIVSYPICQNIIFENNTVKNCPYAALEIASATNVLVKNNTFVSPNRTFSLTVPGCIMILKSSSLVVTSNSLIVERLVTAFRNNISVDSATATNNVFADPFVTPSLPPPWSGLDIGAVGVAGSSGCAGAVYTVSGSGADVWGTSDSFQFACQPWTGDGQIIARVTSVENTDPWAKAGVMIRESLDTNSPHAVLFLSPGNGVTLQGRIAAGGLSASISTLTNLIAAPQWIKLVRRSDHLNGYQSIDGTNWIWVGTLTNNMATNYYLGLAVCSKNNSFLNTSTFDNVSASNPWTYGHVNNVCVADTNVTLLVATNGLAGEPTPFVSMNLSSPWTAMQPGTYTSTYPAISNGIYAVSFPLPSAVMAFFRIGWAPY